MTTNSLLTPLMITRKALMILHNKCVTARMFNRQYDPSFAKDGGKIGSTLKVRLPNKYVTTNGATMVAQDTTETQSTITVATQKHVAMNFTSAELTLSIDDFAERIIAPAMSSLATAVDLDALALYKNIYNVVGTPGTTPNSALALLQANQKLSEFAAPTDNRNLIINPAANASLVDGLKGLFNAQAVISDQFKKGQVASNMLGFEEIAMDQNVGVLTTGAARFTSPIVATTSTSGDSTLAVSGTGTWNAVVGETFTIANVYAVNPDNYTSTGSLQQFVVTSVANLTTSGTLSISPSIITSGPFQTVNSLPQVNAVITNFGAAATAYPQNLAFHKDAFAMVTADLELPPGGSAFSHREVMDGISMRLWRQGDIFNDQVPCRVDVLYGLQTLRASQACRVTG